MAGVKGQRSGGRNAKSRRALEAGGTFRPDRHADRETAEPPRGAPAPPGPLKGEARAEWLRMIGRLEQSKTLSTVDDAVLYQYVQLHDETEQIRIDDVALRKLSAHLKAEAQRLNGSELVDAIGKIVELQAIAARHRQQLRQGHMALRQYLVEFGMTPSARNRVKPIKTDEPKKPGAKLALFTGGKAAPAS